MARRGIQHRQMGNGGFGLLLLVLLVAGTAGAAEVRQYANGIRATFYRADEIMAGAKAADGSLEVITPNGALVLSGDPSALVPYEFDHVDRALATMQGFTAVVDVNVYLLPAVPTAAGGSFARQDGIYLSPGFGPVPEATAAWVTTHEMGHVLTWAFLDSHPQRWDDYMALRGLDPATSGPDADHADRAREILAEDFRYLFGGPEATAQRSIENHDLALPDAVEGLEAQLASYLADRDLVPTAPRAVAYPNPCNPLTTIAMAVPGSVDASSRMQLRVYDIRGALVRTIDGGHLANGRVTIQWNGTTDAGRAVSSGRYLYVMRVDDLVARGAVSLVR